MNKRDDTQAKRISFANRTTRPATMYKIGKMVLMQEHISKRWDRPEIIIAIRPYANGTEDAEPVVQIPVGLQSLKRGRLVKKVQC